MSLPKKTKKSPDNYIKYTSIATQMIVIIGVSAWGGLKLDTLWHTRPLFTIVLILSGVALSIYFAIKDFIRK